MSQGNRSLLAGMVGLAAGTAAAGCTYVLRRRFGNRQPARSHERLEMAVVDALCADDRAGACPIDVAALGPGLIELSGRVPDEESAARAAQVAQGVIGVHTVVSRLVVAEVEQQWQTNARRYREGAPELTASGWEGMSSGMSSRRREDAEAGPGATQSLAEGAAALDETSRQVDRGGIG